MELQATLINFDRLYRLIDGLKDVDKDKVIKEGLRQAGNVFVRAGRQRLKSRLKGTGKGGLMKSFKTKVKRNKLGALAGFAVGGQHSHLVDLGTEERTTNKGKNRGKMSGNNFWTDAIKSSQNQAMDKVYDGIERGITRILKRN